MRLKFQTKLMLAVALVMALITVLVIAATEGKVRETYSRLAEKRFEEQVASFLEMRKKRLEGQMDLLGKVAESEAVKERLASGSFSPAQMMELGAAMEEVAGSRRLLEGAMKFPRLAGRGSNKQAAMSSHTAKRLIFLVDKAGDLHPVGASKFRRRQGGHDTRRQLQMIEGFGEAQAGYLVVELEEQGKQLVEVVIAPVRQEAGGRVLGAVLLGQVMGEVGMEKVKGETHPLNAKAATPGGDSLFFGVMTEGEIFSGKMSAQMIAEVKTLLQDDFLKSFDQRLEQEIVIEIDGQSYRLFCELLNPGGTLPSSYEVVLYPLAQLRSDLRDLRLKGSGVATGAIWIGMLLAWLLARRFARPIREMAIATRQISEGNFEVQVPVRSKDEVGDLARSFNAMAEDLKTKEQIRDVLGKVADEAVAEALISGSLELGGETREVSILFCDIRGFTALSETMEPTDVIEMLNTHMTAMTHMVYEHRGVVDKFIGDEVMAVFGAPKTYGDDAENAARCALKMIEERDRLNQGMVRPIEVGIGVATGSVVVGCIGSMDRLNYTVIGERVNRAARLCGLAGHGQIVVDEVTWQALAGQASGEEIKDVNLRGYKSEVKAFFLRAFDSGSSEPLGEELAMDVAKAKANQDGGD